MTRAQLAWRLVDVTEFDAIDRVYTSLSQPVAPVPIDVAAIEHVSTMPGAVSVDGSRQARDGGLFGFSRIFDLRAAYVVAVGERAVFRVADRWRLLERVSG